MPGKGHNGSSLCTEQHILYHHGAFFVYSNLNTNVVLRLGAKIVLTSKTDSGAAGYQLMLLFWVSFVLRKDKHGSRQPTVILSATALAKFPASIPEVGTIRGHSISQGASGADTKSNILCPWAGAALSILQRPHFFSSPVPNMR